MKNEILFQNDYYAVVDISTNTYPNAKTLIDRATIDKVGNRRIYPHSTSNGGLKAMIKIDGVDTCLHRFIMNAADNEEVDHRDGNPLINVRINLRLCSHEQNGRNRHKDGIKGVHPEHKKWKAELRYKGQYVYLGVYPTKEEAALAYNEGALLFFGDFASLNKI